MTNLTPQMTFNGWIASSKRPCLVKALTNDAYSEAYGPIRSHFLEMGEVSWPKAVVALHIVYGWMPRIPNLKRTFEMQQSSKDELLQALGRVRSGDPEVTFDELKPIQEFCGGSVIGSSKLLHFFAPSRWPKWDTNVATSFLQSDQTYTSVNKVDVFKNYVGTLLEWSENSQVEARIEELRLKIDGLKDMTNIRTLETVLFHLGRCARAKSAKVKKSS